MRVSAEAFAAAGDERNATIQRINQAECLVELGAHDQAHAIAIAHLDSRLSPTIVTHARSALAKLVVFGDRPFLLGLIGVPPDDAGPAAALLLLDLAEGHRRAGALEQAETLIVRALEALDPYPTTRAAGLAVQALILLDRGRAADAVVLAERAFQSTSAESAEQRRMQIVLAYVRALEASGRRASAADHADLGRRELEAQAALIVDPTLRASFLRDVSIHRELLAAAERLGV
jgi:hypothetical protein